MIVEPDWRKADSLLPAIVQDAHSGSVLMLGYMNQEALVKTKETNQVTFFSRTRQCLWTKGETSGNTLRVVTITTDCDHDTILIQAIPSGPVCHLGMKTCFASNRGHDLQFLIDLEQIIYRRKQFRSDSSYTSQLFSKGRDKIAQKVGEEGVEVVIASKNESDTAFLSECADLVYHLTVLLADRELSWRQLISTLASRERH